MHKISKRKLERDFQAGLIKELKAMFPGCFVLKLDPTYIQGIPDLLILYKRHWAALECKRSINAHRRPNQSYYVNAFNEMSFARFVCPENVKQILYELRQAFES